MSNKQLKVKSVTSLGNIIVQLESLIQSFKNGHLTIISNNKALILQPQDPPSGSIWRRPARRISRAHASNYPSSSNGRENRIHGIP